MNDMVVTVRLFAMLKECVGCGLLELDLADDATVADALTTLQRRDDLNELIERMPVATAVNREYVQRDHALAAGDELALVPPVSGGAPGSEPSISVALREQPLSFDRAVEHVRSPRAGAIVTFSGTTRDVAELEYEAYKEMAESEIEKIARSIISEEQIEAICIEHRVGVVPLGETSVIVAVSAAHRPAAFAAARAAIDRIKQVVPIWKKEVVEENRSWVAGTPVEGESL